MSVYGRDSLFVLVKTGSVLVVATSFAVLVVAVATSFAVSVVTVVASFAVSVVTVVAAFAVLMVAAMAAFAVATVTSAAATFAAHAVYQSLNFVFRCLSRLYHMTFEVECLARKRVVKVNLYLVRSHFKHLSVKSVSVFILQRNDCIFEDVFVVKVSVYTENLFVEVEHMLFFVVAVSLFLCQREVERAALFECYDILFKLVEGQSEATYKLERLFIGSLFYEFTLSVFHRVKFVSHGDVFV